MLKRRMLQAGVAIGVLATSILGIGSAANASPTGFTAASVHANGAGALAIEVTGGLTWYSRSVGLTSIHFYAAPNECGTWTADGWQGDTLIDVVSFGTYCGGAAGRWIPFSDVVLDGSAVPGGITEVNIKAWDSTHGGMGETDCYRSASLCL
jgi:hypothetical protein